jgi:hypothetical protein
MSKKMNWRRARLHGLPSRALPDESEAVKTDRTARWLAKAGTRHAISLSALIQQARSMPIERVIDERGIKLRGRIERVEPEFRIVARNDHELLDYLKDRGHAT